LWVAWHLEDYPDQDPTARYAEARDVALRRHAQVLAVLERDAPVAFAQLERDGDAAEITQVYVQPEYRGDGRGTAITREAISAAADVRDLWIVADDEDRPKQLYARLGFRPAWTAMQFLRLP
jgi:GNAT superfamily N-acetyltransferase